jgi:hypothetical protein
LFTTSGTYPWSFVTQIFHNGHPSHGGDNTVSLRICLNPSVYCINVDCLIVSILYQLFSMSLKVLSPPWLGWPLWNICVTNDHGYVPLVVNTSRSFPHSRLITAEVRIKFCNLPDTEMTINLTVVAIALHMLEINKVVKIASDFILFFFPNRWNGTHK